MNFFLRKVGDNQSQILKNFTKQIKKLYEINAKIRNSMWNVT